MRKPLSPSARADELEDDMARALEARFDRVPIRSTIYRSGQDDPRTLRHDFDKVVADGKLGLMGPDPRLSTMPEKPTLLDFFKHRMCNTQHLMQSARLALKNGVDEKVALACLVHDISVTSFISGDHGYWARQLLAPYVDEEIAWGVEAHQYLRFYPDESVGYKYPEAYIKYFGEDFEPEPYIREAYERARNHKWYMTGRIITMNDVYAFDPNVRKLEIEEFTDLIGRHFRQPAEGLGFDHSPSAHMWRTIMWPTRAL